MAIKRWVKGDSLAADHLNEGVDAINNNLPIIGGPGILARGGNNGGTTVSLSSAMSNAVLSVGKIVAAGPNAEANYTDPDGRYWVRLQANQTDDTTYVERGKLALGDSASGQMLEVIVTAHSAAEAMRGARSMGVGEAVYLARVFADQPISNQLTQVRWLIVPAVGSVTVSVTDYIAYGWYHGHLFTGPASDMHLTGMSTGTPVYVLNGPEYGSSLPPINPAGPAEGKVIGRGGNTLGSSGSGDSGAADVRPYVLIQSFSYTACATTSGSGSGG